MMIFLAAMIVTACKNNTSRLRYGEPFPWLPNDDTIVELAELCASTKLGTTPSFEYYFNVESVQTMGVHFDLI